MLWIFPVSPSISAPPAHRLSRETYIALCAATGIAVYLLTRHPLPLWIVLAAGGVPLLVDLLRKLVALDFGSDLLAGLSIVTAVLLREYLVAAIVILMLSGGASLEHYAMRRASAVLDALAKRVPRVAHRRRGTAIADVGLDDVAVGDILVVFPHEICPVDGKVVEGRGTMDESYLTGEPFEIAKTPGTTVLSGAVNGESALTIAASRLPEDSRYAKIMQVMHEAEQNRPAMRRIGDRLGAWYTPFAIAVASLGWALSGDPDRFLAVAVIATPCPLLIAIPVAVIGAISMAARRGIIIKNPAMLERVDSCRTLIFDKTGTLTYGKPAVTEVLCAPGIPAQRALLLAASLEQYSKHPLAGAVMEAARAAHLAIEPATEAGESPGKGLAGIVSGSNVRITGRKELPHLALPPPAPGMECVLLVEEQFAALFRFQDAPRQESRSFIGHLLPRHRIERIMLLSGDREAEVLHLAQQVGITEARFGKTPEEKVEIVKEESLKASTLFVGDGINDAPAMQAATVGVAFGQNSDITAEAADAVVLEASLEKVDELIHIGARMRRIALESALGGMGLSILGMFAAAFGYLTPVAGAVAQEIIDLLAVLNAVRMVLPSKELSDVPR